VEELLLEELLVEVELLVEESLVEESLVEESLAEESLGEGSRVEVPLKVVLLVEQQQEQMNSLPQAQKKQYSLEEQQVD